MRLAYLAFTDRGEALAHRLAEVLGGTVSRSGQPLKLHAWTAEQFPKSDGLIFVGAAGIAVRAVAPHVVSKTSDPAVVVIDECGRFAVSLLSGHLGGANDLAKAVAEACGAVPVITTATDANGLFAVDEWAKRQQAQVVNPHRIQAVSSKLLNGGIVTVRSPWDIAGTLPAQVTVTQETADVVLDIRTADGEASLLLVPSIVVLGIGCRKGTSQEAIEKCYQAFLEQTGLCDSSIVSAASIDLKQDEAGLHDFCRAHGWDFVTYSAERLRQAPGTFTPSAFVSRITGVDNVCERSAVTASGGTLIHRKYAAHGVTMAAAVMPYRPDWRWTNE